VEVVALCDVDTTTTDSVKASYPNAKTFIDYKEMFTGMGNEIDAVVVSTPDHAHAPVSLMAWN
jgi:predicted dehydrogenase